MMTKGYKLRQYLTLLTIVRQVLGYGQFDLYAILDRCDCSLTTIIALLIMRIIWIVFLLIKANNALSIVVTVTKQCNLNNINPYLN